MDDVPTTAPGRTPTRRLARAAEAVHTLAYYTPEIQRFGDDGFSGWWHAYFAYRSAPMGPVPASVVTATFYNFAPRMIQRAVPGCWDIMSPAEVRTRQLELVDKAVSRSLAGYPAQADIGRAAELLRSSAAALPIGARPLYASWAGEPWPGSDLMDLWHGCTLLREFRFDGHNIALVARDLDPTECHLMMTSHGFGNAETIQRIRGWSADEWDAAHLRLIDRGLLDPDGAQTEAGQTSRRAVERHTDLLAYPMEAALGPEHADELASVIERIGEYLKSSGEVHGVWPPPTVLQ
jgi:hypothetical protein